MCFFPSRRSSAGTWASADVEWPEFHGEEQAFDFKRAIFTEKLYVFLQEDVLLEPSQALNKKKTEFHGEEQALDFKRAIVYCKSKSTSTSLYRIPVTAS